MPNYAESARLNVSMPQQVKAWVINRAKTVAEITSGVINASAVVVEAIRCYRIVLDLFGEDWESSLQVQSEPAYIRRLEQRILERIDSLGTVVKEPTEPITENVSMDTSMVME